MKNVLWQIQSPSSHYTVKPTFLLSCICTAEYLVISTAITVFFFSLFHSLYYVGMSSFTSSALHGATIIKGKSCKISLHLTRWIYCCHKNKGPQGSLSPLYWRHRVQAWRIYYSIPLGHCTYLKTWFSWHLEALIKKMQTKGKEPGQFDSLKEKCALLQSWKASYNLDFVFYTVKMLAGFY